MTDPTENARRQMVAEINAIPGERELLELEHGKVWDAKEVGEDFEVTTFMAPFVGVTEKATGKRGTLRFQNMPRYYFDFQYS